MADALEMGEDRHARFGLYTFDERTSATRDDDVDLAACRQHCPDSAAVVCGHHLNASAWQACRFQPGAHQFCEIPGCLTAVAAATQDGGIAGDQAQPAGINRDVGTGFIDYANHTKRCRDTCDIEAVWTAPAGQFAPDRVFKAGYLVKPGRHALDSCRREGQPVDKGGADAVCRGARDIGLVPCEDFGFMFTNEGGGGMKRGFPLVEGRHGKCRLCLARGAHQRRDQRGVIARLHCRIDIHGTCLCGTCVCGCRHGCHSLLPGSGGT